MPLLFGYEARFLKDFSFSVMVGPFFGYWLSSYENGSYIDISGDPFSQMQQPYYVSRHKLELSPEMDNRFSFGPVLDLSLSWRLDFVSIYLSMMTEYDLIGLVKRYQRDVVQKHDLTMSFSFGARFFLGGER